MRLLLAAGVLLAADLLLALWLPSREAGASTALWLELPDLVRRSELIVEARVLAARPVEARGLLLTEYLLEVSRTFNGEEQAVRFVRMPGGVRADGSGLLIPGLPALFPGEEALLCFGAQGPDDLRLLTGLAQGKFALERMPDGRKRLLRDASGLALVQDAALEPGSRSVVEYADLLAAIEAARAVEGAGR